MLWEGSGENCGPVGLIWVEPGWTYARSLDPRRGKPILGTGRRPSLRRLDLTGLLVCLRCGDPLPSEASWATNGARCTGCGTVVPVVRGVLRFIDADEYTDSFSFQWNQHRMTQLDTAHSSESERMFHQKTGFGPEDVNGKLILDVGCGMGRFADVVSRWGGNVIGLDMSYAVEAAHQNLGHREDVLILQADLFHMPFPEESFDLIYSIGVLHHTPDCEKAFRQLPRFLKPGGKIAIWVYGPPERWVKRTDLYRRFTTRMSLRLLHAICHIAIPLYYVYSIGSLSANAYFGGSSPSACTPIQPGGSWTPSIGIPPGISRSAPTRRSTAGSAQKGWPRLNCRIFL
ncbi:MAG: class I SAM-dependent methyltransferase [Acidiferrobacterales bacterium]